MLKNTSEYTSKEILKELRRVARAREHREDSIRSLKSLPLLEFLECLKLAILNATIRRSVKRREREYLKAYKGTSSSSAVDASEGSAPGRISTKENTLWNKLLSKFSSSASSALAITEKAHVI